MIFSLCARRPKRRIKARARSLAFARNVEWKTQSNSRRVARAVSPAIIAGPVVTLDFRGASDVGAKSVRAMITAPHSGLGVSGVVSGHSCVAIVCRTVRPLFSVNVYNLLYNLVFALYSLIGTWCNHTVNDKQYVT